MNRHEKIVAIRGIEFKISGIIIAGGNCIIRCALYPEYCILEDLMRITKRAVAIMVVAACALTVARCDKGPTEPDVTELLIGNWAWRYSYGGYAGQYIYADSVDYDKSVSFQVNSIYDEWINHSTVYHEHYDIVKKGVWQSDTAYVVIIENYPFELIVDRISMDSLVLSEHCYDCYTHTYVRLYPMS